MVGSLSVPSGRCARGTVDGFDLHLNIIVERWLCTKTLILVSVERSVQYRERSAAVAHSTNQPSEFRRNVECAIRSLRSRYCSVGMLLFVQSRLCGSFLFVQKNRDGPRSNTNQVESTVESKVSFPIRSLRSRYCLSLIHISEPTRLLSISYAVFCLKKKKK